MTSFDVTDAEWLKLIAREEGQCQNCGSDDNLTPAHYIARSHMGIDTVDNLILLCFYCHRNSHDGKLRIRRINGHYYFKEVKP